MFTLLRSVVVVGLIFYFSPVRETGQPQHKPDEDERRPALTEASGASAPGAPEDGPLNRLADSLKEEVVRTAVNEKTLAAGLRLGAARALMDQPSKPTPTEKPRSPAQELALRASIDPLVRCVYRCDGSE
jgi:hypothetical protein